MYLNLIRAVDKRDKKILISFRRMFLDLVFNEIIVNKEMNIAQIYLFLDLVFYLHPRFRSNSELIGQKSFFFVLMRGIVTFIAPG